MGTPRKARKLVVVGTKDAIHFLSPVPSQSQHRSIESPTPASSSAARIAASWRLSGPHVCWPCILAVNAALAAFIIASGIFAMSLPFREFEGGVDLGDTI